MTPALLAAIAGLALLDAFNPATIGGVALILLAPGTKQERTAAAFVAGAYLTVFGAGVAVFLGADAAAAAFDSGLDWIRRIALTAAATALLVAGARRLRPSVRKAVTLPAWITPLTAPLLALLVTLADLPNAFPYLVAIERLLVAEVPTGTAVLVLAGYAVIYCLPCLLLLILGVSHGPRVRARLSGIYERFGTERKQPRSFLVAGGYGALAAVILTWAWA
jgi:cytochrome c biogenesis protein CcdA